eukprot:1355200-Amorphochlora_amoeboformis.AAC.3
MYIPPYSHVLCVPAVEELTRKTGNFKKFPIFVKMLATAFSRSSESVFVEMFTYGDLEALRKKRS